MSPTEIVTVRPNPRAAPRQERISRRVKHAIDLMVTEALSRAEAAQKAGITDNNLYQQLRKPAVLAYRSTVLEVVRTSAASRTIAKAEKLMSNAESEHVQLQATQWLAGIEGISPIAKAETLNVHKHMIPGLTLIMGHQSAPGDDARLIGSQVQGSESVKHISNLPERVPHPSERNGRK